MSSASSTGLLNVGAQCAAPHCLTVDFLPIRCACEKSYCIEHIIADGHECPVRAKSREYAANAMPSKFTGEEGELRPLERCSYKNGCTRPSLGAYFDDARKTATLCTRCNGDFCAAHRYPESHSCEGPANPATTSEPKNAAAQALLAKHFLSSVPTSSASTTVRTKTRKIPTDPKKLAQLQKIELMKLRHKASPADPRDKPASVPLVDDRLHAKVVVEGRSIPEKVFWFRKSVGAGRALDMLTSQLGLSNATSVALFKEELGLEDRVELKLGEPLAEQMMDGATLILIPSPQ